MQKGTCIHFNGTVKVCCDAGINYQQLAVGGEKFDWARRLPCMTKYAGPDAVVCDKRHEPTEEELAAHEIASAKRLNDIRFARAAILADIRISWEKGAADVCGRCDCPSCNAPQALHYSRAGVNGHIMARCVSCMLGWME